MTRLLRNCPYCNTKPVLFNDKGVIIGTFYHVSCDNFQCRELPTTRVVTDENEAIRLWNTREFERR